MGLPARAEPRRLAVREHNGVPSCRRRISTPCPQATQAATQADESELVAGHHICLDRPRDSALLGGLVRHRTQPARIPVFGGSARQTRARALPPGGHNWSKQLAAIWVRMNPCRSVITATWSRRRRRLDHQRHALQRCRRAVRRHQCATGLGLAQRRQLRGPHDG